MFNELIEKSVMDYGNNYRLKSVLERAQKGEKIKVGYIGGSITSSWDGADCFATYSFRKIHNKYCSSAEYINEGSIGANSMNALLCTEKSGLYREMDIAFIEFSVNDTRELISRDCFESLVRRLLVNEKTTVILVLNTTKSNYSCHANMSRIGQYYGLPILSIENAVRYGIENGLIKWSDYSSDYSHPSDVGHRFIADCIEYLFEQIDNSSWDKPLPFAYEPFEQSSFESIRLMDCKTYQEIPCSFEVECRNMIILFGISLDFSFGTAEIMIDGEEVAVLQGYNSTAWNGAALSELIINDTVSKEHRIEIRMLDGDEDKRFNIILIGYCV